MSNDGWGSGWGEVKPVVIGWDLANSPDKTAYHFPEIRSQLSIPIDGQQQTITGIRVGDLLVYEDVKSWGLYWIIHVPTLVSFEKAVPLGDPDLPDYTQRQLIDWCKTVQQELRDDWQLLATLSNKTYKIFGYGIQEAKDRIQKHCLAVPVE